MVESFFGGSGGSGSSGGHGGDRNWNLSTIFSMKDISEKTRAHLARVYQTLFCGVGTCALGMYINMHIVLQGFFFMLLFMVGISYIIY